MKATECPVSSRAVRWAPAVEAFGAKQSAAGVAPGTVRRRIRHIREFSAWCSADIDEVTTSQFTSWAESKEVEQSTRHTLRDSGRAFFRWALEEGQIRTNPLAESHRCAPRPAPESWEPHVAAWERQLRGIGRLPTTVQQLGRCVRKFARDNAPVGPWDITTDDILEWFASSSWARETVRLRRSAIRNFYKWARQTKRCKKNPAKCLPVVPMTRGVPRPAAEDDVQTAARSAADRERLAIELAAGLGLRCGELATLHLNDLRERDGRWWLRVQGKGSRERLLPVPENLVTALRARGSGFVFPGQVRGHISPNYLSKRVNAADSHIHLRRRGRRVSK